LRLGLRLGCGRGGLDRLNPLLGLRLGLSLDGLGLGGLRLNLSLQLSFERGLEKLAPRLLGGLRLRSGRGALLRLNFNGLLGGLGLSRQSLRRVELGLSRFRRGKRLGLRWELGSRRELELSRGQNFAPRLGLPLFFRLPLDLLGGFDQRHG
jgi:hypothetical protein